MIGRMMAGVGTRLHDTRVNDSRLLPRRHGCVYVLTRRDGVLVAERNADAALFELLYLSRQAQPSMHRLLPNRKRRQRKPRVGEGPDGDAAVIWEPARVPIYVGAAFRAEVEANVVSAVGQASIELVVALDAHTSVGEIRAG